MPYCAKRFFMYLPVVAVLLIVIAALAGGCLWSTPPVIAEPNDPPVTDPEEEARKRQEEWERRNEELKEELGEYYVPLPPLDQPENPRVKVRGLYITGHTVGYPTRYEQILELVENTELNALVIDIKDDSGKMSYKSEIEIVNQLEAYYDPVPISDIRATLDDLHARGIYTIARIVAFKDNHLAIKRPEWCIQYKAGGVYRDNRGKGFAYANPFLEEVWDYNIAIAKEAALLGFKEIQFDYVRFPDDAAYMETVADYPNRNGRPKAEVIKGFVEKARKELAPYNVYVAHDVFGVIANSWADHDDIGQIWEDISPECDYICPMVYPSHYGKGYFGFPVPDANPVGTISMSLSDAVKRNAAVKNPAIIRPWLQAFTATWITGHINYGPAEVRAQIDAALELGLEEYMLWNPGNVYPAGALTGTEEADRRAAERRERREQQGHDFLNRTARQAVEIYLEAIAAKNWREAYALQNTGFNVDGDHYREWLKSTAGKITAWEITGTESADKNVRVTLKVTLDVRGEEKTLEEEKWTVARINNVWRVAPSPAFLNNLEAAEKEVEENTAAEQESGQEAVN